MTTDRDPLALVLLVVACLLAGYAGAQMAVNQTRAGRQAVTADAPIPQQP